MQHIDYVCAAHDVSIHQDFSPKPGSDIEPMIVYGTFLSSSLLVVLAIAPPALLGLSFGAVSSKISCTTRNLERSNVVAIDSTNLSPDLFADVHDQVVRFIIRLVLPCPRLFRFDESRWMLQFRRRNENVVEEAYATHVQSVDTSVNCLPSETVIPSLLDDRILPGRDSRRARVGDRRSFPYPREFRRCSAERRRSEI